MFLRKLGVCCIDLEFFFSFFFFPFPSSHCFFDYFTSLILKMSCNFIFFIALETDRESVAIVQDGVVLLLLDILFTCVFSTLGFSYLYLLYDDMMYVMI